MKRLIFLFFLIFFSFLNAEWSIVETYQIPEGASGLAFDGTYLYCGIYGANGDEFYRIDPVDGSYQLVFTNSQIEDCFGMTYDGNHLRITDHPGSSSEPAIAYELDMNGNIISQFELPAHYMSGIAYDEGNFWVAAYYNPDGYIYKVDNEGNILQEFPAPDNQPWDLCLENENLWMADYWGNSLYKIDPSDGSLLESHSSEGSDPAGIVFDGTYLWYCDNGAGGVDYLYKVDLGGSGTPQISLAFDEYDFGEVVIEEAENVDLPVTNTGTADLTIISVQSSIPQFWGVFQPPLIIQPNETFDFALLFTPDDYGEYSGIITIESNDPINPNAEISLTGFGVYQEAEIDITPSSLYFGNIRIGAFSGKFIEIINQGEENLIIDNIDFSDAHFMLDNTVELPLNIETNETYSLRVWFSPEEAIEYNSTMLIYNNDSDENPVEVTLQGTGEDNSYPIASLLWQYQINTSYDNSPKAIVSLPDISGDGIADVVVSSEDDYLRCFNGNSSGTADVLWENEIPVVYNKAGLTVCDDIDGDGYKDLVIGTVWGDNSIRAISGKTGAQIWIHDTHEYGNGGWVYQVNCKFDYNDDGIKDILAATGNDANHQGPQRIYCLDGLTGNSIWEFYAPGPKFSVLGIEDATYDGKPDVVAGASDLYETEGIIFGIDGETGNELWSYSVVGSSVWALEQTDHINNNGVKEIIAGDFSGNYYCIEPADGSLIWNGNIGTSLITGFSLLEDVNGDMFPDFGISHSGSHTAIVISGFTGLPVWNQPVADQPWNTARIDDVNGDGINDLLVGTLYSNNFAYFLSGADGSEIASVGVGTPVDALAAIPDITSDGSMEMVVGGRNGWIYCYAGGYDASFASDENIADIREILMKNYPNPFRNSTKISLNILQKNAKNAEYGLEQAKLEIYNIKGQKIRQFPIPDSQSLIIWDGKDKYENPVGSGIYFYKLKSPTFESRTKKMILLR